MGLRALLASLFGRAESQQVPLVLPRSTVAGVLPPQNAELPAGRLITADDSYEGDVTTPVMLCTEQPVKKPGELASRLRRSFEATGLWPLVLDGLDGDVDRPWLKGEFAPDANAFAEADACDVSELLSRWWEEGFGEDEAFPGLGSVGGDAFDHLDRGYAAADGKWLGLFAVERPADVLARIGWMGAVNADASGAELTAVLRSWEERYGAVLVGLGFDTVVLTVGRPPRDRQEAMRVVVELAAFCPDSIHQGAGDLEALAAAIVDADTWHFWWD